MLSGLKQIISILEPTLHAIQFQYNRCGGLDEFFRKGRRYLKAHGLNFKPLLAATLALRQAMAVTASPTQSSSTTSQTLFFQRFPNLIPFPTISFDSCPRINIVTDSLDENSVYGGASTSMVFAMLLANKMNCPLRVITRDSRSSASALLTIAKLNNILIPQEHDIYNFPYQLQKNPSYRLPVSPNDIFIGTSWWSCKVIKEVNAQKRYLYIVQEDERIFYPNGDEHVMVDDIYSDPNMLPIVNTRLLQEYFFENNYEHISKNGICFEPAFPGDRCKPKKTTKNSFKKLNLFFYSRPNVARNLFYTGLDLLTTAVELGIINTNEWNIFFAGQDSPDLIFADGTKPKYLKKLTWPEYIHFLHKIDLGICLMIAPTPSYPPLDICMAGGVVHTNSHKNKKNLEDSSKNIICSDLNKVSLLQNLELAVMLAKNPSQRQKNLASNKINNSWDQSFGSILEQIQAKIT